ncbi:MAG: pectate lyase [Planctomycetaceae bacterium]
MNQRCPWCFLLSILLLSFLSADVFGDEPSPFEALVEQSKVAMRQATEYMSTHVSVNGGYVYNVTVDLKHRRGEGAATPTEVWVQPPGTPTVGLAFLRAYEATGDQTHLNAALEAAKALLHGQLESGCWSDRVDFDPVGKNAGLYRNGRGKQKGRNYSTLDDDKSQAALRFLIETDRVLQFKDETIHEAVQYGLESLLKAQFANGGFPQGWEKPVEQLPVVKASIPTYDWKTEGRFKNYWDFETLNDGLAGTVTKTLQLAYETYKDERFRQATLKFGDFLILAQLPEPQPAWAQQYNHQLQPIWARKFEPPAVAGRESEDAIETLMSLAEVTGERRFLEPIPRAIAWLKRSRLADGQMARFYELNTNKPLYFVKDTYELTYDDSNLPTHYGFKARSKVEKLEERYKILEGGGQPKKSQSSLKSLKKDAEEILVQQDSEGRWITDKNGKAVTDIQGKDPDKLFLESEVFSKHLSRLAEFIVAAKTAAKP